jgi:hypothetical protein
VEERLYIKKLGAFLHKGIEIAKEDGKKQEYFEHTVV